MLWASIHTIQYYKTFLICTMRVSFNTFLINSHFQPPALEITFFISELKLDRKSTLIIKQFSVQIWNKESKLGASAYLHWGRNKAVKCEKGQFLPLFLRYRYFSRFHLKRFQIQSTVFCLKAFGNTS